MNKKVIIITGAVGFLGSSITIGLSRDHEIIAIDLRKPGNALTEAAPGVKWEQLDIAETKEVAESFLRIKSEYGRIDFVLHFAAFCHFGNKWLPEFDRTNIQGTINISQAAINAGVRRLIFASSISAMEPPLPGQMLTEKTPTSSYIPYAKSKAIGENLVAKVVDKLPCIVLRMGGVFSDWCELPPLYSLIRMWSGHGPLSRIIPGRGESGIPYIHRSDIVQITKRCIELHEKLDTFEIFLVSQQGSVLHKELFPVIRQTLSEGLSLKPIYIPPILTGFGLFLRLAFCPISGEVPYERPWMLKFIDCPWVSDTGRTREKLGWNCSPELGILERLPVILDHYKNERNTWIKRNRQRNKGRYIYS